MDLRDVVSAVRHGWWWLVGCLLLGLALAALLVWSTAPLYASSTDLYVSTVDGLDAQAAHEGELFAQERSASYAAAVGSPEVVGRAIEELGLDLTPEALAGSVAVESVPDTAVVAVTVTASSPAQARDLAAALGRQFTAWVTEVEVGDGEGGPTTRVSILRPAQLPEQPVSPDPELWLGLGGSLGFLAGLGLTVLRYRSTTTIRTEDDVRRFTGAPLAGVIPEVPDGRGPAAGAPSRLSRDQAIRGLLANLSVLHGAGLPRVVVVAGVLPDDGAAELAHDLADALADAGRRVVLVRADAHHADPGPEPDPDDGLGLADVLAGTARLSEVAHREDGSPTVVPVGSAPPDSAPLPDSPRLRTLLHALRSTQDHVVVEGPPLHSPADAAMLGSLADGCLLALRYGGTRADQVAEAVGALTRGGVDLLGVVLTGVPRAATVVRSASYRYEADAQRGAAIGERRAVLRSAEPATADVAGEGRLHV